MFIMRSPKKKKKLLFSLIVITIMVIVVFLAWPAKKIYKTTPTQSNLSTIPRSAAFDKSQYSLTNPTSIWVIVNKQRPLNPINYVPTDLVIPNIPLRVPGNESMQVRKVIQADLEELFKAAQSA